MNFDQPPALVPTPEKERRPLSLEQVLETMNTFVDTAVGQCEKPPRIKKESGELVVFVELEIKNLDGSVSLLTYTLDDQKTADATINITHFQGDPDDGDYLGSDTLAKYDGKSAQWNNLTQTETRVSQDQSMIIDSVTMDNPSTGNLLLVTTIPTPPIENYGANMAVLDAQIEQGQPTIESMRNMEIEDLLSLFDQAETVFGAKNIEETLLREVNNLSLALDARNAAKPHLNRIYSKMIGLNRSKGQTEPLVTWNPEGDLTEQQFHDFNERRKRLSNMIGILQQNESGKIGIGHNVHEI